MEGYYIEAKRFSEEAKLIMSRLSKNELLQIIAGSFTKSLDALITSKIITLKKFSSFLYNTGVIMKDFFTREFVSARTNFKGYLRGVTPRIMDATLENFCYGKTYINNKIKEFNQLDFTQKKDLLISGLLWTGMVFLVGGGPDFEGGAPDLDIKMGGIGNHRSVFFHTILLAFSLEFTFRFVVNLLRCGRNYLPQRRSVIWNGIDRLIKELDRNESIMISGIWVGIAIHLFKDANIFADRVKPYVGIPKELSMQSHQNIFVTNSFLSFIFSNPTSVRKI